MGSVLFDTRKGDIQVPALTPASSTLPLGSYDGPIGAVTPSSAVHSTLDAITLGSNVPPNTTVSALHVDTGTKTVTAAGTGATGTATLNKMSGIVTTASLTTANGATYALTLTNSDVAAGDIVMADVQFGTATTGAPGITTVATAAGSIVITVQNFHASAALNGTILISFVEVRVEYQGVIIGLALTSEECRTMAEMLPKCANEAEAMNEKAEADIAAAAAVAAAAPQPPVGAAA